MRLEVWLLYTKEKDKDRKLTGWRAVIRIKGYPSACKTCERKQEAEDWVQETERKIKSNQFNYNSYKQQHTYQELVERWLKRLGHYALVHSNRFIYLQKKLNKYNSLIYMNFCVQN